MPIVLNRRKGQAITIGDRIRIEIVETHRSSVSLRITAPRELAVLRAELLLSDTPNPPAPEVLRAPRRR